ncbi:sigma-54-dependent Fis family transcriptional regulator [Virgibacillus ihumii]|uniref:sigma-54-dependent Fis family transcriptional regulator n=1 Tax=Virgibacillus ihumii TaxID=2686091 RepID=UPI00157C75C1|nr:sigma-54-dependent Fis family transcriptional regulator [Virgibacillus ihumii]
MSKALVSKQTWNHFLENEALPLQETGLSSDIIESWHYCRRHQVNPYDGIADRILDPKLLEQKMKKNKLLLDLAKPHIRQLQNFLKGWKYITTLTDRDGYILQQDGEKTVKNAAYKIYFKEGAKWDEIEVGTNAIGLALRLKKPITVKGYEHFSIASQEWNCTAAPIFDQYDEVIGALNISSLYHSINYDYVLASVKLAADSISLEWKNQKQEDMEVLMRTRFGSEQNCIVSSINDEICSLPMELLPGYQEYVGATLTTLSEETDIQLSNFRTPILNENRIIGYRTPVTIPGHDDDSVVFKGLKGTSEKFHSVLSQVEKVAVKDTPVYIYGETGTGKDLVAQAIHDNSKRSNGPFLTVNCGAVPEGLLESELFGYESGSFTGANNKGHRGKFQQADGGTLFLDEIEEMSSSMQVALLRALQQKEITRIGGSNLIRVNIRIITASNRDIRQLVKQGKFREDLFYRIYVFPIQIPPLKERKEDIIHFIRDYLQRKKWMPSWHKRLEKIFMQGEWRGNVRELYNALERCEILYADKEPNDRDLFQLVSSLEPVQVENSNTEVSTYKEQLEINRIKKALAKCNGKVSDATEELSMSKATLYRKLKKYNI